MPSFAAEGESPIAGIRGVLYFTDDWGPRFGPAAARAGRKLRLRKGAAKFEAMFAPILDVLLAHPQSSAAETTSGIASGKPPVDVTDSSGR